MLDSLERGVADPHWRPHHLLCPFCQLQFTVLARVEDLQEDAAYFALKSNLSTRLNLNTKKNMVRNDPRWAVSSHLLLMYTSDPPMSP